MQPTFKVNTKEFNATLRRAIQESSRAAPDVVNGHAMAVALNAVKYTERANRDQIAQQLGQVGTQLNYTKKGDRLRKGRAARGNAILRDDSFAARIVNARRREHAGVDYMLWGDTLKEAARKLIKARQQSVNFIRSGWLWAVRDLASYVRGRGGIRSAERDVKIVGSRKGRALAAKSVGGVFGSGRFVATIENTSLIASGGKHQNKGHHNPMPIAEKGLAIALAVERANMEAHLAKKMKDAMKKAGAL